MKSIGHIATEFPRVAWLIPVSELQPEFVGRVTCMDAEVKLPNGQIVIVKEIQYHGQDGFNHRFSGVIK